MNAAAGDPKSSRSTTVSKAQKALVNQGQGLRTRDLEVILGLYGVLKRGYIGA